MAEIYEFDPQIYPRKVWIMTTKNLKYIQEHFCERNFNEIDPVDYNFVACVIPCRRKSDRLLGFLLWIYDYKDLDIKVAAHEAYHLADGIVQDTGMCYVNSTGNEHVAYLVGYYTDCICKVKNKKATPIAY